jgi:branched-chain amino acid transport system permease protein
MPDFTLTAQCIVSGLVMGSIYALVALGFSLIYNVSGILNIAQGEVVMIAGMAAIWLQLLGVPFPIVFLVAILVGLLGNVLVERLLIIPRMRNAPFGNLLCLSMAAGVGYKGIARIFWGVEPIRLDSVIPGALKFGEVFFPKHSLLSIGAVLLLVLFLWFFLFRTMTGKALRAVRDNPAGASVVGIEPGKVVIIAFCISGAVGALGAVLVGPITMMSYAHGELFLANGIAAAIVGGMGNVFGAFAGGYIIGLAEQLSAGLISPLFKGAVALIIIIIVLAFKPYGLFGKPRT